MHRNLETEILYRMQASKIAKFLVLSVLFTLSFSVQAQEHHEEKEGFKKGDPIDTKEEIKKYIDHHLLDSYDFTFWSDSETGEHMSFPLPVILFDNGIHIFSSSKFHHGEEVAEVDGNYYKIEHNKIYKTNAAGTITHNEEGHPTNARPLDFSLTKNVVMIFITAIFMFFLFKGLATSYTKKKIPTGLNRALEPLVIYVRDDIAIPNIGEKKYRKYMGFLLTVFFFIFIINLLGLTPLGVNVTNSISVTLCLALITFFIVQFSGNKGYWKHVFWMPGVPVPMKIILMPIEVLGLFIKPFSLMIRLYANITAGHVVIMSLLGLIFIFKTWVAGPAFFGFTLFISVIELLVAFLQAYIFTLLSALYIGSAVEEHDHHDGVDDEIPIV